MDKNQHPLLTKCKTKTSFKNQMEEAQKKYFILLQATQYADFSIVSKDILVKYPIEKQFLLTSVVQSLPNDKLYTINDLYFYYAEQQPMCDNQKDLEKLTMRFISNFPKPKKDYTLVYFSPNNTQLASSSYTNFKKFFTMLPLQYYIHLKNFIITKCSYMQKAAQFLNFGIISKYVRDKTTYANSLEQICKKEGLIKQNVVKFLPQHVLQGLMPNIPQIRFQNPKIKTPIKTTNIPSKKIQRELNSYEVNEVGIPMIIHLLVTYFKANPQGLKQQGIFRKSISIDTETKFLQQLENKQYDLIEKIENPHLAANIIKRFFSNLKTPLIPYEIFEELMQLKQVNSGTLKPIIIRLPIKNLTILMFLLDFLIQKVLPKAQFNQMSSKNLSICFAPCLMRSETPSIKDIMLAAKSNTVFVNLIDNFEEIFGDKKNQQKLYRSSFKQQKKGSLESSITLLRQTRLSKPTDNIIDSIRIQSILARMNEIKEEQEKPMEVISEKKIQEQQSQQLISDSNQQRYQIISLSSQQQYLYSNQSDEEFEKLNQQFEKIFKNNTKLSRNAFIQPSQKGQDQIQPNFLRQFTEDSRQKSEVPNQQIQYYQQSPQFKSAIIQPPQIDIYEEDFLQQTQKKPQIVDRKTIKQLLKAKISFDLDKQIISNLPVPDVTHSNARFSMLLQDNAQFQQIQQNQNQNDQKQTEKKDIKQQYSDSNDK